MLSLLGMKYKLELEFFTSYLEGTESFSIGL
jgi:hypothetical protein